MVRHTTFLLVSVLVTGFALVSGLGCGSKEPSIEYRYAKVDKGELIRSISSNGVLVPLTSVDVKSKAGGRVVQLSVEEGSVVKKGDLVALIDPADTRATFDQSSADLSSAQSRVDQSRANLELQKVNTVTSIRDAEIAVAAARTRLQKAIEQSKAQPELSKSELASAEAALQAQRQAYREFEAATLPQTRRDAETAFQRTKTDFETASANYDRQLGLLEKGYVSQSAADSARSQLETARAAFESAKLKMKNLDKQLEAQLAAQTARLREVDAAYRRATANQSQIRIVKQAENEARQALAQAEINLERARGNRASIRVSEGELAAAKASTVRSRVAVNNAKVQLDSTTVLAPRDGVVTLKYLEEGTIIPPGTSTFAQGTSLVQISDISRIFVDCQVDEADISQVREGQNVRVLLESMPGRTLKGKVTRVNPAAITTNNITTIKVRVEIRAGGKEVLMPGMTATCEFLTLDKQNVVKVPAQAIKREGEKTYVMIKSKAGKPEKKWVKVGEAGNDGFEVLEGLAVGEEVVVAEIDLDKMRELQKKMEQAQQGGGLAGGRPGSGMGGSRGGGGGGSGSRSASAGGGGR